MERHHSFDYMMRCSDNRTIFQSIIARKCNGYCPNLDNHDFVFGQGASVFASVFAAIFSVTGFGLNLLVIVSLLLYRRTREHVTTPFIVSLSISDFIYSAFILPIFSIRFATRASPICGTLCKLFPVIFYGNMAASLLSLTMVTLNRVCMLFFPAKVKKIFRKKTIGIHEVPINSILIILACWIIPFALVFSFYLQGRTGLFINTGSCTLLPNANCKSSKSIFYIIGFGIPCFVLFASDIAFYLKVSF